MLSRYLLHQPNAQQVSFTSTKRQAEKHSDSTMMTTMMIMMMMTMVIVTLIVHKGTSDILMSTQTDDNDVGDGFNSDMFDETLLCQPNR
jgi:hypothetical protein